MTDHVVRLYALAVAVLAFFVTWAVVAAQPWKQAAPASAASAVSAQLAAYEQKLVRTGALADLLTRKRSSRTAPVPVLLPPRIVTLPPVTVTRTS